jgi:mono/diheme cytochrome c family protein
MVRIADSGRAIFMKRSSLLVIIAIALVAAIGIGISILHDGLSARAAPTKMEKMAARKLRLMSIPASARAMRNPVNPTLEILHDGLLHFSDHCAICHANDGSGDTMIGKGLYPKPPDLRLPETQKLSDGELFWTIENGIRFSGMPAFGGTHGSETDSWKLVLFIRHLPQLTTVERLEMERNNPKGPGDRREEQEENEFLNGAPLQQKPESQHHH